MTSSPLAFRGSTVKEFANPLMNSVTVTEAVVSGVMALTSATSSGRSPWLVTNVIIRMKPASVEDASRETYTMPIVCLLAL